MRLLAALRFALENEEKDPALQDSLFRFTAPPDVE